MIYADHDEYTTFYASTRSNLNRVVEALAAQGFDQVRIVSNCDQSHHGCQAYKITEGGVGSIKDLG